MPFMLKVRKVGNSAGVTIPKEALARLRVDIDDTLYLVETSDGFLITPYDTAFEEGLDAFEKTRKRYRNALRKLSE
jgi:putative addiction module antidote